MSVSSGQNATSSSSAAAAGSSSAAVGSSTTSGTAGAATDPSGDWLTFDYGAARNGVGPAQSGITAGDLGRLRLRTVRIPGVADSSAVELHGVTIAGRPRDVAFVTTSYGRTIAIDAGTGAILWQFVASGVNSSPGNPQVTSASPTIDPDRRYIYSASSNGVIHKLSVATGRQVWARSITFDPRHEKIASALTTSGRFVIAVTGGYYGDIPPYDGHVVTLYRSSGAIAHVFNTLCSDRHRLIRASTCPGPGDGAIWGRAGAVIEPGSGRILIATGNGPFNGSSSWGDSVLELSPDAAHLLHNWTPTNQAQLNSSDTDLGSASPALLPLYGGRQLAVQGGKDGQLHLLDLARLDGTGGGAGPRLGGELSQIPSPGGGQVLTAPAVWSSRGRVLLFVGDDSGTGAYELVGGADPRLRKLWENGTPGTSPVIAGGLLYVYNENDGALVVRSPLSGNVLRSLPTAGGHWNSPIVIGGRIILPTGTYHDASSSSSVEIYHLPGR
jgi:hypothetical protein